MKVHPGTAFTAGAITALVLGTGTAYAATGGKLILGHTNTATQTTTLTNYRGNALSLRAKQGYAPFRVNSSAKVRYLNTDYLDGLDGSDLALAAPHIGTVVAYGQALDTDTTSPGPDMVAAIATCPSGSQLVGGGGMDLAGNNLFWNSPGDDGTWVVVSDTTDYSADNVAKVEAHARCWNPRADVADVQGTTTAAALRSPAGRKVVAQLRHR